MQVQALSDVPIVIAILLLDACSAEVEAPKKGETRICVDAQGNVVEDAKCAPIDADTPALPPPPGQQAVITAGGNNSGLLFYWMFFNSMQNRPAIGSNVYRQGLKPTRMTHRRGFVSRPRPTVDSTKPNSSVKPNSSTKPSSTSRPRSYRSNGGRRR